ncbi:MAG: hypothetical protein WD934_06685 [Gemmatimonadales bacterium]
MKYRVTIALFAVACQAVPSDAVAPSADGRRVSLPAADVAQLTVRGRDGSLRVRPTSDPEVRVTVHLTDGCDTNHRLATHGRGDLTVQVTPSTHELCREQWTVWLPAGIAMVARLDDAAVDIADVRDAVTLSLGHGTARLTNLDGDLSARVTTGDIHASGAAAWSHVRLAAQVGRVRLDVGGTNVPHARAPGSGDWIEIPGTGGRRIRLETTVGNVTLRLDDR